MKKFFTLLSAFSLASIVGCHEPAGTAVSDPAVSVQMFVVRTNEAQQTVNVTGVVQPHLEVDLTAQIVAPVATVLKSEGDHFHKGEVLVRLHAPALDAQVTQANAALSSAEKQANVAAVQATLSASSLARYAQLRERHSVTSNELDQMKAQSAAALAQQQSAAAQVAEARASVVARRANAEDAVLCAPFDGVVTRRMVDPGAMAAPGVPLLHLQSDGQQDVGFSIPDTLLPTLRIGSLIHVQVNPTESAEAKITNIAPAGDPASHTFFVKAALPASANWNVGTVMQVVLSSQQPTSALLIPAQAVVQQGGLDAVLVIAADSRASVRYVTLGSNVGDQTQVFTGLRTGDRILTHGDLSLAGRRIAVRP